jgi:hypothetical protein
MLHCEFFFAYSDNQGGDDRQVIIVLSKPSIEKQGIERMPKLDQHEFTN